MLLPSSSSSAGGLAAYFNAYPTVKYLNKTYVLPSPTLQTPVETVPQQQQHQQHPTMNSGLVNPAPGVCLPIIVKFCQQHNVPYNFTVYPNYIGNFGQIEAQAVSDEGVDRDSMNGLGYMMMTWVKAEIYLFEGFKAHNPFANIVFWEIGSPIN